MSEDEFFGGDNEAAWNGSRFSDSPEFQTLKEEVAAELFEINGQISTLQQFTATLKSFIDRGDVSAKVVERINKRSVAKIEEIGGLIKKVNTSVKKMDAIEEASLDKTQIIAREKLVRDVGYSFQEFQGIQRQFTQVMKQVNERAKESLEASEMANDAALLDEEQRQNGSKSTRIPGSQIVIERDPINNEEFAYQQNLIEQRDQEISNIERGITELNEVFKDLGSVVQQQGVLVDNIEANIYTTSNNTQLASDELRKAMRYQKRTSRWRVYLLIVLLVMLLFIFLIMKL
ncbi:BMC_2a_G0049620.mRNA.1.CDS.1 [Saccharomyces cerevisiae]|nr:Pep12p [Saccharomyces cerevisiae YJM1447]CAI4705701.1 BMC_2a_G0049620.mRNA.1.CDS.1 [Saccharomyces cerevisiae]CAI4713299.1 BMB_G0049580.mRNA.1.CDS.1 [Saccharomyces cerevisiae]CAI7293796.1 BMC_2a_G0049620.mRNA.1.CDS.1 [Saccharomyces cerevisiae]CAI7296617.1 BMB_G0049580.mRNA.1.CDS.1 [Saccharomyces cerevisiae]